MNISSEFIKVSILSILDSALRAVLKSSKFRFISAASFSKSDIKLFSPLLSESPYDDLIVFLLAILSLCPDKI
jgi:hypothetical protein